MDHVVREGKSLDAADVEERGVSGAAADEAVGNFDLVAAVEADTVAVQANRDIADDNGCEVGSDITGWLAVVGLIVLAFAVVRFWKTPGLGWWARVHATLLLAASVAFISFAWYGHLLSPSLKF